MTVNTAKVEGRRTVNYASFDELLADADRVSSGPVKALGNWSAGQIFRHLAIIFNGSIDGWKMSVPWYLRLLAWMFRRKILTMKMPPGFNLPPEAGKILIPPPTSTEEGLADLKAAVARLEREPPLARHPVFGAFTPEEWKKLHLNHASMHMSFLIPQ